MNLANWTYSEVCMKSIEIRHKSLYHSDVLGALVTSPW